MRFGIVLDRSFLLRHRTGVLEWKPEQPGLAVVRLVARGRQGQTAATSLRIQVDRPAPSAPPPFVGLQRVPEDPSVGSPAVFVLRAGGCRVVDARISWPTGDTRTWRFPCPVRRGRFTWTPTSPGSYLLTTLARGSDGVTASQLVRLQVGPGPSSGPSPGRSGGATPSARPSRSGSGGD
jgi:hypothetical protein